MDRNAFDCRVTWAYSYEVLPHPSEMQWRKVVPRPSTPASTWSVPSLDAIDTDMGCMIASALFHYALVLHQRMYPHGVLTFPSYVGVVNTPSLLQRSNLRLADMSANTLIERP